MLANISYCPVLFARVAEIKAVSQLPIATKDAIFPLFRARPWPNAKLLERSWEKISEAFPDRWFALDLDLTKRGSGDRPAQRSFDELFVPDDGFQNYYRALEQIPRAVPVLRTNVENVQLERQLEHVEHLNRGLVLHLEFGQPDQSDLLRTTIERYEDVTVFIDTGWSRDLLQREMWASQLVQVATEAKAGIELVVSGSSFPASFQNLGSKGSTRADERYLHDALVRRHNAAVITYGDWGSTREPMPPVPMKMRPRIDVPMTREWISFRSVDGEDYREVASRAVADPLWPSSLDIWGTYVIRSTAEMLPGEIRGPAAATAARINIHIHRQAHFNSGVEVSDGDEPFVD